MKNTNHDFKPSSLPCQAPTTKHLHVVTGSNNLDKKITPDFTQGSKKFSAQFDLSAKSLQCGCMIKHNPQNQTTSLQNDCQAPTTKDIQVVTGSNKYWFHKTARRTYKQEEFFNNPSPSERVVPTGYSRSRHGLAMQINAKRSKKFIIYLQQLVLESEFGNRILYGSQERYAKKLGVDVRTIKRWDKDILDLKLMSVRHRPGLRTNQRNISKVCRDNRFLALLDGVSITYKKVINNFNQNVPQSITYGKDIKNSLLLGYKKEININACARALTEREEILVKESEINSREEESREKGLYREVNSQDNYGYYSTGDFLVTGGGTNFTRLGARSYRSRTCHEEKYHKKAGRKEQRQCREHEVAKSRKFVVVVKPRQTVTEERRSVWDRFRPPGLKD